MSLGAASYDQHEFGHLWWLRRQADDAHRQAHRQIAQLAAAAVPGAGAALDYACGPGGLLIELAEALPETHLIGLDESAAALQAAGQRLESHTARLTLRRSTLPELSHSPETVDLACFCFPDFRTDDAQLEQLKRAWPADWLRTEALVQQLIQRGLDPRRVSRPGQWFADRLALRDLTRRLSGQGRVVVADYALGPREGWSTLWRELVDWCFGCRPPPGGVEVPTSRQPVVFARRVQSTWHPSPVILDVHAQTGRQEHTEGGYVVTVLRGVGA